jgi:hypothetical protein
MPSVEGKNVSGCAYKTWGVSLNTSDEYHWLVGAGRRAMSAVRQGAGGGDASPARGCRSTEASPNRRGSAMSDMDAVAAHVTQIRRNRVNNGGRDEDFIRSLDKDRVDG